MVKKLSIYTHYLYWICFYFFLLWFTAIFDQTILWSLLIYIGLFVLVNLAILLLPIKRLMVRSKENYILEYRGNKIVTLNIVNTNNKRIPFPFVDVQLIIRSFNPINSSRAFSFNSKSIDLSFDVSGLKRGFYQSGVLNLTVSDFFGLFKKNIQLDVKLNLFILPRNSNDALPLFNFLNTEYLTMQKNSYTNSFNIKALREYQEGDPLNLIDWKSSSKRNELMTRVYESEKNRVTTFYFFGVRGNFERLVSLAYTYTLYLLDSEEIFDMTLFDDLRQIEFTDIVDFCKVSPIKEEELILNLVKNQLSVDREVILFTSSPSDEFYSKIVSQQGMGKLTLVYYDDSNLTVVSPNNSIVYSTPISRGKTNEK